MKISEPSYPELNAATGENEYFSCDVSIECRHILEWKPFRARILFYNRDGMYFESDVFVGEGGMIFYQLADPVSRFYISPWKNLRTVSLAEVLSCLEIADSGSRFGITVRYYRNWQQTSSSRTSG